MPQYEYQGTVHPTRSEMYHARRVHYAEPLNQGMNFTKAARMAGVPRRTGRAWRNGRTGSTGERTAPVDRYPHGMGQPKPINAHYPSQSERIGIAHQLGHERLKRPKPRRTMTNPPLFT